MIKRLINYISPPSKFKRGDEVLIDENLIKYTYGYILDMEYSGVVLKTFTASSIYLVRLNFSTGNRPYTGVDEEIWFSEKNLSFVSKVDDRDYKINSLLQ